MYAMYRFFLYEASTKLTPMYSHIYAQANQNV